MYFEALGHFGVNATVVLYKISVAVFETLTGEPSAELSFVDRCARVELLVLGRARDERVETRVAEQYADI